MNNIIEEKKEEGREGAGNSFSKWTLFNELCIARFMTGVYIHQHVSNIFAIIALFLTSNLYIHFSSFIIPLLNM